MTAPILIGLLGMLAVACWPTADERRRRADARAQRHDLESIERRQDFTDALRHRPYRPGTAR